MKTRIIQWVMTWDRIVTKTHKQYLKEIGVKKNVEAYMQLLAIKKTLESVSLDYRSGEESLAVQINEFNHNDTTPTNEEEDVK